MKLEGDMNPRIPSICGGCEKPLLLENLFVDDGCPCNTPRGINFDPKPCAICKTDHCVKPGHRLEALFGAAVPPPAPIPMFLVCPNCHARHIDEGEFATKPHHTHACQYCGLTWRPAVVATVGVRFLPGFKNETAPPTSRR